MLLINIVNMNIIVTIFYLKTVNGNDLYRIIISQDNNFFYMFSAAYCLLEMVDLSILWCNMIPITKLYILLFSENFPIDE